LKEDNEMIDIFSDYIAKINGQPRQSCEPHRQADLIVKNGQVVLPDCGVFPMDVYIRDGKILQLKSRDGAAEEAFREEAGARVLDARNKYVIPGIIDPHVHLGLFAPLETELVTETRSALLGGITTMGVFFGGNRPHSESFPAAKICVDRLSYTDVFPHLVISTPQQKNEIQSYVKMGITSFKAYMNGIPGLIPSVDDGFLLDVMEELKRSGRHCILCVHAENNHIVQRADAAVRESRGEEANIQDWADTHPPMAEEEAVMRVSYLAEQSGTDIYLVHISSEAAVKRLREIKGKNRFVHIETTSPYLSVNRDDAKGNLIKMEPPFRDASDIEALWKALDDGIVDTIGTDNVSQTRSEKKVDGSLWETVPGYPALATHLPVCLYEGVIRRGIPIEKLIVHMTKRPAEIFGVYPRKGTLLPGSDADLVLVDMDLERRVQALDLWSRSDFSIYEGRKIQGWPVTTVKGGAVVVDHGVYVGGEPSGRCLQR